MNALARNYGFFQAPIPTEICHENLRHMAVLASLSTQPKVDLSKVKILATDYPIGKLRLDLYGSMEDGEACVETATLAGTEYDMFDMLDSADLRLMSVWCDEKADEDSKNARLDAAISAQELRDESYSRSLDFEVSVYG